MRRPMACARVMLAGCALLGAVPLPATANQQAIPLIRSTPLTAAQPAAGGQPAPPAPEGGGAPQSADEKSAARIAKLTALTFDRRPAV
ncbi:MAG: hypothetical protein EBR86_08475, partial [Planctomycetia bacterium]|nr:hypothetical protein [Planctomycetia bacterium]